MKKLLLTLVVALVATCSFAQKVTLDFTSNTWGLPTTKTTATTSYTSGNYTISVGGDESNGFKFNTYNSVSALLFGKAGAAVTLPAFDFAVGKIKVYGSASASAKVTFNIFVGENAASTEVTGSTEDHTFDIASNYQTAGNIYSIKVTNANNAQISKIEIYEVGDDTGDDTPVVEGAVTVAEAQAAAANTEVTVAGQVYATTTKGGVIGDATGYIYHYANATPSYKVGDAVTIAGAVSAYGGFNQFPAAATVTVGDNSAVTYPDPVTLDGTALDAWFTTPVIEYVKVTGTLSISGSYYNLTVDGASTAVGSIIAPTSDITTGLVSGSTVTVYGFAMYTSGGKYVNIAATKITIDEAVEDVDISNTPETAYTTTKGKELVDANQGLDHKVYVSGTITKINSVDTSYGNATYFIATEGTNDTIEVYRGYYLNDEKFTAEDQIKVGDQVIVYGQLTLYYSTYEITSGNYLYSVNGITDGIKSVATDEKEAAIFDLSGRRVNKATKGIYIINGKKVLK